MPSEPRARRSFRKNVLAIGIGLFAASLIVVAVEGLFYVLNHRTDHVAGEDPYLFQFSD